MLRGLLCSIWSGPCASYYCGSVCFCYPHFVSVWKFPWTFSINIYSILRMEMRMGRMGSAAGGDLPKCQTYEVPRDCKAGLSRNQEAESWKQETEAFISLSQLIFLFISMFVILAVVYIPGMQELYMERVRNTESGSLPHSRDIVGCGKIRVPAFKEHSRWRGGI